MCACFASRYMHLMWFIAPFKFANFKHGKKSKALILFLIDTSLKTVNAFYFCKMHCYILLPTYWLAVYALNTIYTTWPFHTKQSLYNLCHKIFSIWCVNMFWFFFLQLLYLVIVNVIWIFHILVCYKISKVQSIR